MSENIHRPSYSACCQESPVHSVEVSEGRGTSTRVQLKDLVQQILTLCTAVVTVVEKLDPTPENPEQNADHGYLKSKIKELVDMNVKWQMTCKEQDERINQLEQQLAHSGQQHISEQQQMQIDRVLLEQKEKYNRLEEEKCQIELENSRLRQQLERVPALEMQLMMYREDFETERRDRERAQGELAELRQTLERGLPRTPLMSSLQTTSSSMCPSAYRRPIYQADVHDGVDVTDSVLPVSVSQRWQSQAHTSPARPSRSSSDLSLWCPKCGQGFTADKHVELIEHMDLCTD